MSHTILGRYRILGELGRGAMGTVYRALDPLIEREVAIKTLHSNLPEEVKNEVHQRFLREAKSAGRLNHPNIVTIFDVGEHDGIAYMAMELLDGRSLQQMLGDPARLPFQTIAELVAQVADALDRAQQLGIVHRDVKPANIVVSASGHAKLTDFGVAFVPASTMTQTSTMIGSPRYMSPEQVLGLPVDPRSDIFSLGVVLYEMLAGHAPFVHRDDTTIFPLINRIASEPHPPLRQADPSIPAAFEAIVSRALAKKPGERYQRAGEMASDLRNLHNFDPSRPARTQVNDEATVVGMRRPQADPAPQGRIHESPVAAQAASTLPPESESKAGAFVLDLDTFSRNFEAEEQARLRAEEEARRRKEEELRRWSESEVQKREEFERRRQIESQRIAAASAVGTETGIRRGALDALKKQASTRSAEIDAAAVKAKAKAKADADLDQSMRAALHYLAEIAREMKSVKPTAGRPYDYVFLGRLPAVRLSDAFADLRSRKIGGKDQAEQVIFRFWIQPTVPAKALVLGADIARCNEFLKALRIPFEARSEAKNDFGQMTRASFTVSAALPCEVNIRASYDDSSVEFELVNVRRPGRILCRLEPKKFDDAVDDLARYILGADDDFDKLLNRP